MWLGENQSVLSVIDLLAGSRHFTVAVYHPAKEWGKEKKLCIIHFCSFTVIWR